MRRLGWGVLSTAKIGLRRQIPAIQASARGRVVAIASRDAGRAAAAAGELGIPRSYGSYDALLADPAVEAVYNPLPNHLHVPWTIRALEAGKHVLCEKPIALTAAEGEALIAARDRSGRQVVEAFTIRHHPQWQRTRALVQDGRIGEVRAIHGAFVFAVPDPRNVRNQADIGGGGLYDVGCYPLVAARYIWGAEPERAIALIERDPTLGVDILTSGLVAFPGGRQLVFTSSLRLAPHQRVVLMGTRGRIEVPLPFTPPGTHACQIVVDDGSGSEPIAFEPVDQFTLQADAAARLFLGEIAAAPFPIEDAVQTMRVIDALYRSGQSGAWERV